MSVSNQRIINDSTWYEIIKPIINGDAYFGDNPTGSVSRKLEILQWLSVVPYKEHHTLIDDDRLEGTGEWLLSKTEYKEWRQEGCAEDRRLLFLRANGNVYLHSCAVVIFTSLEFCGLQYWI